ncbi:BLUF domain-containing protein [Microbacterium sp. 1P10UB]|uniref:BLUF domain-containing protein n=1 Tax=unclassified Microbacterium TaxID=2609290 RepID=UPI0039A136C8
MSADDGQLLSVTYSSAATADFDDADLAALLAQSRESNERLGLTGMLLYRSGRFIQILEGPRQAVRDLVARIGRDSRHADMRILLEERVPARWFSDWTMGYEPIAASGEPAPAGFRDTFDDLEGDTDERATLRAVRELSIWFRARAGGSQAPTG